MKPVLDKLHKDHINFVQLLSFLEKELHLLEEGKHSDFTSIVYAIKYMKEYPDYVHHPLEDVIFKYFLEHHKEAHKEIVELLHEHAELPKLTEKLLNMLESVVAEIPQKRDDICDYLKEYLSIQKEHLNREEAYVYPVINSTMDENDWNNIDSELAHVEDPLFGKNVEKVYKGLLQQIVS